MRMLFLPNQTLSGAFLAATGDAATTSVVAGCRWRRRTLTRLADMGTERRGMAQPQNEERRRRRREKQGSPRNTQRVFDSIALARAQILHTTSPTQMAEEAPAAENYEEQQPVEDEEVCVFPLKLCRTRVCFELYTE
jgi:hypothetical protein